MNKEYLNILKSIGLTENESEVYLAGIESGVGTVDNISRKTSLKRPNVYKIIDSLISKNLASVEFHGLKKLYKMENPENLVTILKEKDQKLASILPELLNSYNRVPSTAEIKISYGLVNLKKIYTGLIEKHNPHDYYYVISNLEKWKGLDDEFLQSFVDQRIKKDIHIKILSEKSEYASQMKQFERNFNQEVRFLPTSTSILTDTIITPKKLLIVSLGDPITIFEIENYYLINSNKSNFETIWELIATKVSTVNSIS